MIVRSHWRYTELYFVIICYLNVYCTFCFNKKLYFHLDSMSCNNIRRNSINQRIFTMSIELLMFKQDIKIKIDSSCYIKSLMKYVVPFSKYTLLNICIHMLIGRIWLIFPFFIRCNICLGSIWCNTLLVKLANLQFDRVLCFTKMTIYYLHLVLSSRSCLLVTMCKD